MGKKYQKLKFFQPDKKNFLHILWQQTMRQTAFNLTGCFVNKVSESKISPYCTLKDECSMDKYQNHVKLHKLHRLWVKNGFFTVLAMAYSTVYVETHLRINHHKHRACLATSKSQIIASKTRCWDLQIQFFRLKQKNTHFKQLWISLAKDDICSLNK
jgi:hypothetical protein